MVGMTHTKLIVREPAPGSFFWALMESDERGAVLKRELESADSDFDSYEAALAAGTRALRRLKEREPTSH
ncbi:MAG: hypothetical protein EOP80_16810 [Variovorax sp.]|nr:MAG: hypothetical protein EOP80_16810 [Variovorax sp.]